MDTAMKFDPKYLDPERLLRALHLRPRPKSEEEKRYGTFNRRMMAVTIDSLLITGLVSPIIDYYYMQHYGAPSVSIGEISTYVSQQAAQGGEAASIFFRELQTNGYWQRLVMNLKWQYYAYALYSVVCWHFWNATPGKLICQLQVVDAKTGGRMSDTQSILRVLGYMVSALPFGLGFFWMMLNKKRRGWHDYFAGTEVVIKQKSVQENH